MTGDQEYRVQLDVLLLGPVSSRSWDEVARALALRVEGLHLAGGIGVLHVRIDEAEELDA